MPDYQDFTTIPVGQLGIIALPGCEEVAKKISKKSLRRFPLQIWYDLFNTPAISYGDANVKHRLSCYF